MITVKTRIDTHCKLKNLIIKPTLKCNGNCSFCSQRLNHYKENHASRDLSFGRWLKILDEAASLGVRVVNISGGEPTLCEYLIDLVIACTKRSLEVNLKTNGFLVDDKLVEDLATAGLNSCTISIYSHNPKIHNRIKKIRNSHNTAVEAVKKLKNAGIKTNIQTVLTPHIMKHFDEYLDWVSRLNIDCLFISFLEGDSRVNRPSPTEISDFVLNMIPQCKITLTKILKSKQKILNKNLGNLDSIYNFDGISYEEMSKGIYNKGLKGCGRNSTMALILANGEIHPCNAVEYFHEPVVGNLMRQTLIEAWRSMKWKNARLSGLEWCDHCPMNRHTFIKFTEDESPLSFYSSPV